MTTPTLTADNALPTFVEHLIAEKGLEIEDPEVLQELKNDLLDRLEVQINASLLALLSPAEQDTFMSLLDENNPEAIQKFLSKHIPNMEANIAQILLTFKSAYLA